MTNDEKIKLLAEGLILITGLLLEFPIPLPDRDRLHNLVESLDTHITNYHFKGKDNGN